MKEVAIRSCDARAPATGNSKSCLFKAASQQGCKQMITVIADRSAGSIALCAAAGVREKEQFEKVDFIKSGRRVGTTAMQRRIGARSEVQD